MKVRKGFVSNSSSSSFIVEVDDKYRCSSDIAYGIMKDKEDHYKFILGEEVSERTKESAITLKEMAKRKFNKRIFVSTPNYDTYVIPLTDKYIYIYTCNNMEIRVLEEGTIHHDVPDELSDIDGMYSGNYGEGVMYDMKKMKGKKFFLADVGVYGRFIRGTHHCDSCYSYLWNIGGKKMCPICDAEEIRRAAKIEKITKAV